MNNKIPYHLGLIIDGNRRWAKKRNLPIFKGHKKGLQNLEDMGDYLLEKGVKILTVYVFSYENWKRTEKEINFLMKLLISALSNSTVKKMNKKEIRIKVVGNKDKLSKDIKERIKKAEELTKDNNRGVLNLAVSYSGRIEIIDAIKKIIKDNISSKKLTEDLFEDYLYLKESPDLIIRTGGEKRLSNFLTWQSAYSELYFSDKLWPSFTKKDIDDALNDYAKREKRFGK